MGHSSASTEGLKDRCHARLQWRLREGNFVYIKEEGGRVPWCVVSLGAQVHKNFHLDDSLVQVELGKNAATSPFFPEECACSGLTGLPRMTGKESIT